MDDLRSAGKALPGWLFTPASADQREQLDEMDVLGLDVFADDEAGVVAEDAKPPVSSLGSNGHASQLSNGHTSESRLANESEQSNGHTQYPPPESPRAQLPEPAEPPGPSASLQSSQYESAQRHAPPTPSPPPPEVERSPISDDSPSLTGTQAPPGFLSPLDDISSDDDDGHVPVKKTERHVAKRTRPQPRKVFPSSPPRPRSSSQTPGDTDEEDLSDYEREKRRAQKTSAPPASAPQGESLGVSEESISRSQDSGSFNLSRFPQSAPLAPSSPIPSASVPQVPSSAPAAGNRVLVPTTTDESMPTDKADGIDPSPPELVPEPPTPAMPRKRPRNSGATTASAEADDEASLERPSKRLATQAEVDAIQAEMTTPVKSSWEPPSGQRVPSTVGRPRPTLSVAEAVRQIPKLEGYRPNLTNFSTSGMSREEVERLRSKAIEEREKAARRRRSGL